MKSYFLLICLFISKSSINADEGGCSRPVVPKNGRILELENVDDETFPVGFEINLECDDGHTIQSDVYGTKCVDGKWESEFEDCTPVTCSDPGEPDNGLRVGDSFNVGDKVTFACDDDYHIIGSAERTCLPNGRWTGTITVCDNGASDCPDPGVPLNSYRVGNNFNVDDTVEYFCKTGYTMLATNSTRKCLEYGYWSGEVIECYGTNEFTDTDEATETLTETVTEVERRKAANADETKDSIGGVYILIDTTSTETKLQLDHVKEFTTLFIEKIKVSPTARVGVIAYGEKAHVVVSASETDGKSAIEKVENLKKSDESGHNMADALNKLYDDVSSLELSDEDRAEWKTVVFIISDGHVTGDGSPVEAAKRIEKDHNAEFFAFAVGSNRNKELLTEITPNVILFSTHKDFLRLVRKGFEEQTEYPCGMERPSTLRDSSSAGSKQSKHSLSSIVGGSKAARPWPWIAGFYNENASGKRVTCGGSIINKDWILTAAHCFSNKKLAVHRLFNNPDNWLVVVGRTDMNDKSSGIEIGIEEIHYHPQYDYDTIDNDIALIKLKKSITFDHYTRPICLPPHYEDLPDDTKLYKADEKVIAVGWGLTLQHNPVADFLMNKTAPRTVPDFEPELLEMETTLHSDEVCHAPIRLIPGNEETPIIKNTTERMFCAGGDGIADTCQGDSGGPLMQKVETYGDNPEQRWFQVGIVSWGIGCAAEGFYGYYSYVAKLRSYIEEVTGLEYENLKVSQT